MEKHPLCKAVCSPFLGDWGALWISRLKCPLQWFSCPTSVQMLVLIALFVQVPCCPMNTYQKNDLIKEQTWNSSFFGFLPVKFLDLDDHRLFCCKKEFSGCRFQEKHHLWLTLFISLCLHIMALLGLIRSQALILFKEKKNSHFSIAFVKSSII